MSSASFDFTPLSAAFADFKVQPLSVPAFVASLTKTKDLETFMPSWVASNDYEFVVSHDGVDVAVNNCMVLYSVEVLGAPANISWDACVIPQVSFPRGFIDVDVLRYFCINDYQSILAALEDFENPPVSVPQPVASQDDATPAPDVNGKEEAFVNLGNSHANLTHELNQFLQEYGYDSLASIIVHNGWKTLKEKFEYVPSHGAAFADLMRRTGIQSVEVVAFFNNNCSSMNMELSQNHFSTVQKSSDAIKLRAGRLFTATHVFRFDTPFAERLRLTEQPINFSVVSNALDLPTKISGCIMSAELQIALSAMYLVALIKKVEGMVIKEPYLTPDGKLVFKERSLTSESSRTGYPTKFNSSGALGQVAYCVKNIAELKMGMPVFSYGGTKISAAQLHLNFNALDISEKYGFQLALTRARQSRAGTLLDDQYKGCYVLMELGEGVYVPYDPTYVRIFHILSDILANNKKEKRILISIGSKKDLVLIDYIIEFGIRHDYVIRFTTNFGKLLSYQSWVVDEHFKSYVYVDLNNPKNQNDYLIQGPGGLPDSEFTMRVTEATSVYALVSWASRVTYSVDKTTLRVVKGDVRLPTNKLLVKHATGYSHWIVDGVVPIGHHAHTVQRILTWVPGGNKIMVGVGMIESNDIQDYPKARPAEQKHYDYAQLLKYQIPETLLMSQQRSRLYPCYSSKQIKDLELTPRREEKVAKVDSVTFSEQWE